MLLRPLSPRALEGLKNYQYKAGGYTILDDLHTPLWNYTVSLFPTWLAPNLITTIGLVGLVLAYVINAYYALDYSGEAPRWAYVISGLSVIVYVNLDSLDGKQARRTKSSSPLGQLFDHGCDALTIHLLLANIGCSLQVPCGWKSAGGTLGVMITWMLGQFEEYHTSTMCYGNGIYGIMEANYTLAAIHFITYFKGPQIWKTSYTVPVPGLSMPVTANVGETLLLMVFITAMLQSFGQLRRAITYDPDQLTAQERGNKSLGPMAAMKHLLYIGVLLTLGGVWQSCPTTEPGQCRAVTATFGVVYALVASQLIMSHMCKEPFTPSYWGYVALLAGLVNTRFGFVDQQLAVFVLGGLVLAGYLLYVTSVVRQICDFLGIKCFTIKPAPKES